MNLTHSSRTPLSSDVLERVKEVTARGFHKLITDFSIMKPVISGDNFTTGNVRMPHFFKVTPKTRKSFSSRWEIYLPKEKHSVDGTGEFAAARIHAQLYQIVT